MKVVIDLQEAFRIHYETDKFEDSLRRIVYDMVENCGNYEDGASGRYEFELLDEFMRAFPNSYQIDEKSGAKME